MCECLLVANGDLDPILHYLTPIHLWWADKQTDWQTDKQTIVSFLLDYFDSLLYAL